MPRIIFTLFILGILLIKHTTEDVIIKRRQHVPQTLTLQNVATISSLTNTENLNKLIDGILIPRVVGTPGHENVRNFITGAMRDLNWQVDFDAFEDKTPILGKLKFENIIATLNPNAERFLVLACHYDSKYFPNEEFLGATDSAVPCAMLINIAHEMNAYLQKIRNNNDLSIKFIFFDGEEAFKEWGPNDSIYGARHLAQKWENEGFLPKIDILVLLDLLGAPDPAFYSYFKNTEQWYSRLITAEEMLEKAGHFDRYQYNSSPGKNGQIPYFQARSVGSYIDDDHVPFLRRGVPILHLIPSPFPEVWHKMTDDRKAIDINTVENLNKIFRVFIAEYLHLPL